MKRLFAFTVAALVLLGAAFLSRTAFSRIEKKTVGELEIEPGQRNPWTHLRLNNGVEQFQFAIVSDRTGGHRARIFSQTVQRLNLLQPEFVLSVGDLIEGYTDKKEKLAEEWKEFDGYVQQLEMPFFYVPGNHDISNPAMEKLWKEKLGKSYYHFVYRNVLFLILNTEDPPLKGGTQISPEQIAYVKKVLETNRDVRWTIVALHKPLWVYPTLEKNGWLEVEKNLAGRKYTVFAGHVHRYRKFVRNGMNYYQLATTGGGSKLRGNRYGEFDHIVWVTMKKDGPVLANIMIDGVYPEDLKEPLSEEPGVVVKNRKPVFPVTGKVVFQGKPLKNAQILFYLQDEKTKKFRRVSDALSEEDGSYAMTTYGKFDGVPQGEYWITVARYDPPFDADGKPTPNLLPEKFSKPETAGLKVTVKGTMTFDITLSAR